MKTICPESIMRQFTYELEEWERLLAFLKQENANYKSRLADIVSTIDDEEIITEAEEFNDDFLSQDHIIDFLTEELRIQNKLLKRDPYLHDEWLNETIRHQKRLRSDIEKAEDIFLGIKKNFSGFLSSLL